MRHAVRSVCAYSLLTVAAGCAGPIAPGAGALERAQLTARQAKRVKIIDDALRNAAVYLRSRQSSDGAWRSDTYGMFRGGYPLTPYVMGTLFFLDQGDAETHLATRESFRRGVAFLMKMVDDKGNLAPGETGLPFPVLTAVSASRVVKLEHKDEAHLRAHRAFLDLVWKYQLTEDLGWSSDDPQYGGWGFSIRRPRKPAGGRMRERFFESNMVATIFGIGALRSARVATADPRWKKVLTFVKRCQNFEDDPAKRDPRFDDGGFFFIPEDELQNKAGLAGADRLGRKRFNSYGTMTADGLRALIQCGLAKDHPRVAAARAWLEKNFSARKNPGTFTDQREFLRGATYYYWCWSVSHAFSRAGVRQFQRNGATVRWAEDLADAIVALQRADGSWTGANGDAREDDPLVATPWAAAALASCRHLITAPKENLPGCTPPTALPHGGKAP